jgi:hypothetical protein
MPLVLKTKKGSPDSVEILGVGVLGPDAKGGVPIEVAAERMTEFQEKNAYGAVVVDEEGEPRPLKGAALQKAAREFAELRGLEVVNVAEEKIAELPTELGSPPDRPDAREVSLAAGERDRRQIEEFNERMVPVWEQHEQAQAALQEETGGTEQSSGPEKEE